MNTLIDDQLKQEERKRAISKKWLMIFLGIMLLLTFFSNTINNFALPRVEVESPSSGALMKEIQASGEVIPKVSQNEYTTVNSRVANVYFKAGETVKQGQVIMTLDNTKVMADYQEAMLNLQKLKLSAQTNDNARKRDDAKQKYDSSCQDYERTHRLYQAGAESTLDLEKAENEMKTCARNYQQACDDYELGLKTTACEISLQELKVKQLKQQLDSDYELRAKCNGLIREVNFTPGSLTDSSKPLFIITDQSQGYEFKMTIDSDAATYLKTGDEFTISLKAANRNLQGKVARMATVADGKTDIFLDVAATGLAGGENGDAFISKEVGFYDYLVSNSAVQRDNNNAFVWLVCERQGAFRNEFYLRRLNVSVINSDGSKTALKKGLIDREQQIVKRVDGTHSLTDGCRVLISE